MGLKDWSTWLKYGMIGLGFGLIVSLISFLSLFGILGEEFSMVLIMFNFPSSILYQVLDLMGLFDCSGEGCITYFIILSNILIPIDLFCIFASIGWIVEK
jgi:hypothetical protein